MPTAKARTGAMKTNEGIFNQPAAAPAPPAPVPPPPVKPSEKQAAELAKKLLLAGDSLHRIVAALRRIGLSTRKSEKALRAAAAEISDVFNWLSPQTHLAIAMAARSELAADCLADGDRKAALSFMDSREKLLSAAADDNADPNALLAWLKAVGA